MRLYRIVDGRVTDRRDGPGIGALTATPAGTLGAALAAWLTDEPPTSIALCGMAGSRNGLSEVGYLDCPTGAQDWAKASARLSFQGIPLRIGPGLACTSEARGPDVMRGEETQIFGALALDPALCAGEVRFILPGTHSKWVRVEYGQVCDFRTCLSGELFALLRDHSILLSLGTANIPADEAAGYAAGLDRAAAGAGLIGTLFEARARQLRGGRSASWALGFLSGLVIGTEIAEQRASEPLPDAVILIGTAALTARYRQAFSRFGLAARTMDGETCALRGLELMHDNR